MSKLLSQLASLCTVFALFACAGAENDETDLTAGDADSVAVGEAALTTQSVELHQVLTVWGDDSNCVDITIKNLGSSRTAPFTYDFTINGWYVTQSYKQNNPIRPGRSIVFFCCADGMALTSCEMNGYPYYITPDDIWPD